MSLMMMTQFNIVSVCGCEGDQEKALQSLLSVKVAGIFHRIPKFGEETIPHSE